MAQVKLYLHGGHSVIVPTRGDSADQALEALRQDLGSSGWRRMGGHLVHPGSIASIEYVEEKTAPKKTAAAKSPTPPEADQQ